MSTRAEIERQINHYTDPSDSIRDSTLQSSSEIADIFTTVHNSTESIEKVVSLGGGTGALAAAIGEIFNAEEVHTVDSNGEVLEAAAERGLITHERDLETDSLPIEDGSVDLVVSFGLLEHLTWYDNILEETTRVLRDGGFATFAMPNMAGWTNRLSLLFGYQPRNVEFSKKQAFGLISYYENNKPISHVHTPTVHAFRQYLEYNFLTPIQTVGLHPYQQSRLIALIDKIVSRRPTLCRRFAVLAQLNADQ